ncbi:unnamed protein product, partial [marine sediment metagenome]
MAMDDDTMKGVLGWLQNELASIHSLLSGVFSPSPSEALKQRPFLPFRDHLVNHEIRVSGDVIAETRGDPIYISPALNTHGLTLQNTFVSVKVRRDTLPQPAGWTLLFTVVLEGTCGSSWVEIASAQLNSNGLRREFP